MLSKGVIPSAAKNLARFCGGKNQSAIPRCARNDSAQGGS